MRIQAENIKKIALEPNRMGDPILCVVDRIDQVHEMPLSKGYQIHIANEFLRSLDHGIEVKFESYSQYGQLLDLIDRSLKVGKVIQ